MEHNTKTSPAAVEEPVDFRNGDNPSTVTEHHSFTTLVFLTAE